MLEINQKTIINSISLEGIGLHSGKGSKITIFPGNDDQGIVFKRIDLNKNKKTILCIQYEKRSINRNANN